MTAARHRDAAATRERILDAARHCFALHGYGGSTVREVAAAAGVSPNLIGRYFGGKPGLFAAATAAEMGVGEVLEGPPATLGRRIAALVVARWESADDRNPLVMMLRSAGTSDQAAARLTSVFERQATGPLAAHLVEAHGCGGEEATEKVAGVGALIIGVIVTRYVLRLGAIGAAEPAALEAWLGDRLQHLLEMPPSTPGLGG